MQRIRLVVLVVVEEERAVETGTILVSSSAEPLFHLIQRMGSAAPEFDVQLLQSPGSSQRVFLSYGGLVPQSS